MPTSLKSYLLLAGLALLGGPAALEQGPTYVAGQVITSGAALPATCTAGAVFIKSADGLYFCNPTDTWTAVGITTPAGGVQSTFLATPGSVIWTSGLSFTVSAGLAYIQGVSVPFAEQSVTLDAADGSNPRIDAIVVGTDGIVVKVTGTPAANPTVPTIDPGSQLQLGFVTVATSATTPTVTDTLLYAENVGSPTEWNCTDVGTTFDCNSTNNPRSPSTKDIEITLASPGDYVQLEIGSGTVDPNVNRLLYCYIRPKATWLSNRGLQVTLRLSGVQQGQLVTINPSGSFGFVSSTLSYQLVAIPVTSFAVPGGSLINQVRIAKFGAGSNLGAYIDDCYFQANGAAQPPLGITLAQADARYRKINPETFVQVLGAVGAAETIDWALGYHVNATLDENLTLTFSNPPAAGRYSMSFKFLQDGSGTNTVGWPSNVDFTGGTACVVTAAAGGKTDVILMYDATTAVYSASCNLDMQ